MSHLKLPRAFLSLILGTVAFQGAADDLKDAGKIAPPAAQSLRWFVAQTAGTTPQTINRAPTLGDSALELELTSKYGITGRELQVLSSELRSKLSQDTISRYETGAKAYEYAVLARAISYGASSVDRWKRVHDKRNDATGFHGSVYVHEETKEAVVVFEGTKSPDGNLVEAVRDWGLANFPAVITADFQHHDALDFIVEVIRNCGPNFRVVGHSLGGRLAQIIAATLGREAYTFNPAAVGRKTIAAIQADFGRIQAEGVQNIVMSGESLDAYGNSTTGIVFATALLGRKTEFNFATGEHNIDFVMQHLINIRRVYEDKIKPMLVAGKASQGSGGKDLSAMSVSASCRVLTGPDVKALTHPPAQMIQVDICLLYKCGERLKTKKSLTVFAAPDSASPRVGYLAPGAEFEPLSAAWVTTQPQVLKVRQRWAAEQNAAYWFEPGDLIYLYAYWGEGCSTTWTRGYLYGYFDEGHRPGGNDVFRKDLINCLMIDSNPPDVEEVQRGASVLWIKLKMNDGRAGWIRKETDNLELAAG